MALKRAFALIAGLVIAVGTTGVGACSSKTEAASTDAGAAEASIPVDAAEAAAPDPLAACTRDPGPADPGIGPGDGGVEDPVVGGAASFTLAEALAGFPSGTGVLTAVITTELGNIVCQLDEAKAPISVANFVGLARGTRPSQNALGVWKAKRFYDGLIWHRVIPGFVVQGGDPQGNGGGGPGYDVPNENHVPQLLGVLSSAAGSTTDDAGVSTYIPSGSQFYVVVGKGPPSNYNVFGKCTTDVAQAIAAVPTKNEAPVTKIHMQRIEIGRCP
jgi:peptidyl-prolyl cis-trans isomerase A (cyclophilin A)